jgi:hypothetical protein
MSLGSSFEFWVLSFAWGQERKEEMVLGFEFWVLGVRQERGSGGNSFGFWVLRFECRARREEGNGFEFWVLSFGFCVYGKSRRREIVLGFEF